MWLKVLILLLFVAIVVSLTSGMNFLLRDAGVPESKRTLYALGIRITLAALLLLCIFIGLYTGILSSQAPWDRRAF